MDNTKFLGELLMVCGCLHDIAEKAREEIVKRQLEEVQKRLQEITDNHLFKTDR